jgi:hypothetical protein
VVLDDRPRCLDSQTGYSLATIVKRQVVLLCEAGLYGDSVTDFDALHFFQEPVFPSIFPNTFGEKPLRLILRIIILPIGTNHPVIDVLGCGLSVI